MDPDDPYPKPPLGHRLSHTLDVNGDGLTDLIQMDAARARLVLYIRRGPKPDLLQSVEDGLGARSEVGYRALGPSSERPPRYQAGKDCAYPQTCVKSGIWVVDDVRRDNGMDGSLWPRTVFSYKDGRFDRHGHGFLGFRERWETTSRREGNETILTTKHFLYRSFQGVGKFLPFVGNPEKITTIVERRSLVGTGLRHETVTDFHDRALPDLHGRGFYEVFRDREKTERFERRVPLELLIEVPPLSSVTENFEYGSMGRARKVTTTVGDAARTLRTDVAEVTEFNPDKEAEWLFGPPREVVTSSTVGGQPTVRTTRFIHNVDTHFLERTEVQPNGPVDERLTVVHTQSGRGTGQLVKVAATAVDGQTGEQTRENSYSYDSAEEIYRETTTNALGMRTQVLHHPAFDAVAFSRNVNGVVIGFQFDTFGRLYRQDNPTGVGDMTVQHLSSPLRITATTEGGTTATQYFDRLGRVFTSKTTMDGGAESLVTTLYDVVGRRSAVSQPHSDGDLPFFTRFAYDEMGRLTSIAEPTAERGQREVARYLHSGLTTTTLTPPGSPERTEWDRRTETRDARGLVIKSAEVLVDRDGTKEVPTELAYGPFDLLEEVRVRRTANDPVEAVTSVGYDALGRRTRLTDPSAGVRRTSYNGFGEAREERDALDPAVVIRRDLLGRIERRTAPEEETAWTWDTAPNGLGRLASSATIEGTESAMSYDRLGRPVERTIRIAGQTLAFGYHYDPSGRLSRVDYPETPGWPRFRVQPTYDPVSGVLKDVRNTATGAVFWSADRYDVSGNIVEETLGGLDVVRHFVPETGRLLSQEAKTSDGRIVSRFAYDYYADGNVRLRTSGQPGVDEQREHFQHDSLGRLERWQAANGSGQPQPGLWKVDYRYDELGNVRERTAFAAGATSQTATYGYGGVANASLYAVSSWTISSPGAPPSSGAHTYDPNGRVDNHGRLGRITYNSFDLPKAITGAGEATFLYDSAGARAYKRDASGTTLYAGLYELKLTAGGDLAHLLYVQGGNRTVAQVTRTRAASGALTEDVVFLHRDHLGSITAVTDGAGAVLNTRRTDPFGARTVGATNPALATDRETPATASMRHGFTGHEHDDLDIINMGGRIYDPVTARFLTPDPLTADVLSNQSHNRYSYVLNAPLALVDPTGFAPRKPPPPAQLDHGGSGIAAVFDKCKNHPTTCLDGLIGSSSSQDKATTKEGQKLEGKMMEEFGIELTPEQEAEINAAREQGKEGFGCIGATSGVNCHQAAWTISQDGLLIVQVLGGKNFIEIAVEMLPPNYAPPGGFWGDQRTQLNGLGIHDARREIGLGALELAWMVAPLGWTRLTRGAGCPGCVCFLPGTQVQMADGTTKAIEEVQEGDWILADDPTDKQPAAPFQVVATQESVTQRVISIQVRGADQEAGVLKTTGEHPFWTQTDGWVAADELVGGDLLLDQQGQTVEVIAVSAESRQTRTFNLTVEGVHTFFVVVNGVSVLVHNQPRIHPVAPDWAVKGAHVTASNGVEIAIRGGGETPVYKAVFSSDLRSSAGRAKVAAAIKEVREAMQNPSWRARLLERTKAATAMLGKGAAVERAGSGGTRALEVTLKRLVCP